MCGAQEGHIACEGQPYFGNSCNQRTDPPPLINSLPLCTRVQVLPGALTLAASPLLQPSVLTALQSFFARLALASGDAAAFAELRESLMQKGLTAAGAAPGGHLALARCVAALCALCATEDERVQGTLQHLLHTLQVGGVGRAGSGSGACHWRTLVAGPFLTPLWMGSLHIGVSTARTHVDGNAPVRCSSTIAAHPPTHPLQSLAGWQERGGGEAPRAGRAGRDRAGQGPGAAATSARGPPLRPVRRGRGGRRCHGAGRCARPGGRHGKGACVPGFPGTRQSRAALCHRPVRTCSHLPPPSRWPPAHGPAPLTAPPHSPPHPSLKQA